MLQRTFDECTAVTRREPSSIIIANAYDYLHFDDAMFSSDGKNLLHGIVSECRRSIWKAVSNDLRCVDHTDEHRRWILTSLREKSSFFNGSLTSTSLFFLESPNLNGNLIRLDIDIAVSLSRALALFVKNKSSDSKWLDWAWRITSRRKNTHVLIFWSRLRNISAELERGNLGDFFLSISCLFRSNMSSALRSNACRWWINNK